LESYKGPLTRSKRKNLEIHQETQDSTSKVVNIAIMGDREEQRNEVPEIMKTKSKKKSQIQSPQLTGRTTSVAYSPSRNFSYFYK
jgi:hypothetical protein